MTKIVYNAYHGGFGLSEAGMRRYAEIKGIDLYPEKDQRFATLTVYWTVPPDKRPKMLKGDEWYRATQEERIASNRAYAECTINPTDIERTDPALVQVVEELGSKANGGFARLQIAEVPTGSRYRIDEYDGAESVETPDSYDWKIA